jgi:hypothetical protein
LHTRYSDEKIVMPGEDKLRDRSIPTIVECHSDTVADAPCPSSSRPATPRSLAQISDLNPSLGGSRQRSISDAYVISDINDTSSPYDVRDEEAPLEPFFTSTFQAALQSGLGIADKVVTAINRSIGTLELSNDLERLCDDARRLRTFQSTDTRTIAVLGDSGEGDPGYCLI